MSLEGKTVEEIQALAELADSLSRNPKTRTGFLQLTKNANPDAAIPEIDIPFGLQAQMKPYIDKIDALSRAAEKRELEDRVRNQREALVTKGIPRDKIADVEKVMVDKGIANHETAWSHMQLEARAAEPSPATTAQAIRRFDKPTVDLGAFKGDSKAWSYAEAYKVIDEGRQRA